VYHVIVQFVLQLDNTSFISLRPSNETPPWVLTASSLLVLEVITQEADCFGQSSLVSSDWLGRWRKQISKFYPFTEKKVTVDLASLGITYIALAISGQRGVLSCCLRPRRHQPKLCKIVRRKTRSSINQPSNELLLAGKDPSLIYVSNLQLVPI
jgi:hypothetical protein